MIDQNIGQSACAQEQDETNVVEQTLAVKPTKRSTEFTSEDFKLELSNLPHKLNFHVVKSILEKQFKLHPHRIKLGQGKAYISFKNQQERDAAIEAIHEKEWKGRTLFAKCASARDDPAAKKRMTSDESGKQANRDDDEETLTDETIKDRACPLWNMSYEKQIEYKDQLMRSILNMSKQVIKLSPHLKSDDPRLYEWAKKNDKISCHFDGVVHSPVLKGYRNKCEFNIGSDGEVGFKVGRYKSGSDRICRAPPDCPILSDQIYTILDRLRTFLKEKTTLKCYDLVTHDGSYRQVTIRSNQKNQFLIIIDMHPQDLSQEQLEAEMTRLVDELKSIEQVVSVFFNISEKSSFSSTNQSLRHVYGQDSLIEELAVNPERPLKFRIGPASFFQVNTQAAEVLYRSIIELAQLGPKSFVLDVGCGTGTIGLSLAHRVKYVIGIEIVPQAIEDAKANAIENGIDNVSFYAGKAEDLISESLKIIRKKMEYEKMEDGEVVAIVDPPRIGFNSSFIKTIRASNIKKLIYVACDPKANTNLLTLCRPKSKAYQGEPFVPVRAKAFDLFPHTKFCELVLVYKRLSLVGNEESSK